MNQQIVIQYASEQDVPALISLLRQLFSIEADFEIDEEKQRKGLKLMLNDPKNRCIMVARYQQQVVGMCSAQMLISTAEGGKSARIEDMVIDEKYQRAGVGNKLLAVLEQWALERGAKRLELLADRNNFPAFEFYKKNQWKQTQLICLHKK